MSWFNKREKLLELHDGSLLNITHVELIVDHHIYGNNTKRIRLSSGKWLDNLHVSDVPRIMKALGVIQ